MLRVSSVNQVIYLSSFSLARTSLYLIGAAKVFSLLKTVIIKSFESLTFTPTKDYSPKRQFKKKNLYSLRCKFNYL